MSKAAKVINMLESEEGMFNVFWKRNGKWNKLNNVPMPFEEADAMVKAVQKAKIKSVTGVDLHKIGAEPKALKLIR